MQVPDEEVVHAARAVGAAHAVAYGGNEDEIKILAKRLKATDRASLGYAMTAPAFFAELGKALLLGAVLMLPVLATMVILSSTTSARR